jgi:type IV secretion system protein VirD4
MQEYPVLIGRTRDVVHKLPGTEHVALHARTGTGKTSNFVIPNLFEWPGSAIVLDIKDEVRKATAGHRHRNLGQKIYVFNPTDPQGRTHQWNPFDAVDRNSPDRFDQISRQAYMLFPESGNDGSNAARFWEPAGRAAFISVANLVAETSEDPFTVAHVLHLFSRGDYRDILHDRIDARRKSGQPYTRLVVEGISDFLGGSRDMVESVRKTLTTRLQAWQNPRVAVATNQSHFDLRNFRREPTTLYVTVTPGNIPRMRPLLRLLFEQFINLNTDVTPNQDPTLQYPVLLVLDEFARLGKMETLAESLQFARGFGIRILLVVQNKAQIKAIYGINATTDIFDNLGCEMIFGTGDIELAGELEKRLGDNTVLFDTTSMPKFFARWNWRRQNISRHPHKRPLMLDQEILRLRPDLQIILRPGMDSMLTQRVVWYNDPYYLQLVSPPPQVPVLPIDIPLDDGSIVIPQRVVPFGAPQPNHSTPGPNGQRHADTFEADDP